MVVETGSGMVVETGSGSGGHEVAPEDRKWSYFDQASDWLGKWNAANQKPLENCG